MIAWALINVTTALLVAAILVFKLAAYYDTFNWGERIGMTGMAAMCVLRVGPILGREALPGPTPFDDWSVAALHISMLIFFSSRLYRIVRHWRRNDQAKREATAYLASRGKL
ncbi:hypothetical protein ABIC65_001106 [Sphingomonas trueperi]|uniref:hypothetical protein n=1 Tax=Sphingomonas trueperi TaxID=53317 RepID=UPI003393DF0C